MATEKELKVAHGPEIDRLREFEKDLAGLINKYNLESLGNIPDYMLAEFLRKTLQECSWLAREQNKWLKVPE